MGTKTGAVTDRDGGFKGKAGDRIIGIHNGNDKEKFGGNDVHSWDTLLKTSGDVRSF